MLLAVAPAACAPGYYTKPDDTTVCEGCAKNSWCPGGVGSNATKNLCGNCCEYGHVFGTQLGIVTGLVLPGQSKLPCCKLSPMLAASTCPVLCCAVLCCAVLCCAVLLLTKALTMLCCTVPFVAVMTVTTLAQNASACITQPGCGFQPADGSASVCKIGSYSSGNNQQPCTPCPAGLTTSAAKSESVRACMAPPGYFFQV